MNEQTENLVEAFYAWGVKKARFQHTDGRWYNFWVEDEHTFQLHREGDCPTVYSRSEVGI